MSNHSLNLEGKTIAELRKIAKAANITGSREWTAEDFKRAIYSRRSNKVAARVVDDPSTPIPPGYARIQIAASDGDEGPVTCLLNKFTTTIPRDVIVDVPYEVVDTCLGNSTKENPKKRKSSNGQDYTHVQHVKAYQYTEYGRNDSVSVVPTTRSLEAQSIREKYKEIFGKWPKRAQQDDFEKHLAKIKMMQLTGDLPMDDHTKAVLGLK